MKRLTSLLAVLLVLQVALAVGLSLTRTDLSGLPDQLMLIRAVGQEIDQLTIDGTDGETVSLRKLNGVWIIPEDGDFPADQEQVITFLTRLQELKRGMPVGTTPAALTRFKVTDTDFERRITLQSNGKDIAVVFLGTSPRARVTYARSREDTAVFEVKLAAYDAPARSEEWQDEAVVEIAYPDIRTVEVPGVIKLIRNRRPDTDKGSSDDTMAEEKVWRSPDLGPGESIHQQSADALARKVSALRIIDVLGREMKPVFGLTPPALTVTVETTNNGRVVYELGTIEGQDDYVLKASTRPEYFRLPDYLARSLLKAVHRDSIVRKKKEPTD